MKLLSLFSGIGAFEKALVNLKIPYELVAYCEIDKYASKSYSAIHGVPESMNLGDITQVDEKALPKDIDLVTYGFPCQDISLAGKQKGLFNEDGTQTRSGLFFEALRIIEETQPRVAIAENVKNLTSKKFNAQFQVVLESLEQAGYNNYWQVLNAKDYGIPQNRERVFIVSIRKDIDTGMFQFPEGFPLELRLKDMLEDVVDEKYYLKSKDTNVFKMFDSISEDTNGCIQVGNLDRPTTHDFSNRVYSPDGLARTLMGSGGNQNDKAGQYLMNTEKVINVGNVNPSCKGQNGAVIDSEGLARTITQEKGEGQKVLIRKENGDYVLPGNNFNQRNIVHSPDGICRTIIGQGHCGNEPKVLVQEATKQGCSLPDKSIQLFDLYNGREINPDICGTITTGCSRNGSGTFLVREATKKGYAEAYEGDSINLEQPNNKTRRGRVGHGMAQTLTTSPQQVVVEPNVLTPKRTEYGKAIRKAYEAGEISESRHNMTEMVPRTDGIANTLTTVLKDNYVAEPFIVASRGRNPENPSDRTAGSPTVQRLEPNSQGICNTLTTVLKDNYVAEPIIQKIDIPQTVLVRKYPVDTDTLCETLRYHKALVDQNNNGISNALGVPVTKVEHWFRRDDCFAIPDPDIWMKLKELLEITTDEFDESIMTFEEKEGVYEKSERHYFADGIAPTLTSTTAAEKVIEPSLRIRKLTPCECFRLMGFDDEDFLAAKVGSREAAVELLEKYPKHEGKRLMTEAERISKMSNTQLYKQAGNSIVVQVPFYILQSLLQANIL